MREFLVAYSEYEQQMHTRKQDGGDRVLVDSMTQVMVADGVLPWQALGRPLRQGAYAKAQKKLYWSRRVMRSVPLRYSVC